LFCVLVTVMVAPGIIAPVESVTDPKILALSVCACRHEVAPNVRQIAAAEVATARILRLLPKFLFIVVASKV
jgi:hypothetical protein